MSIPKRLPFPLSERLTSVTASLYNRQGREFDVAVGGIPFMLATHSETPQGIETIKVRKDQFDTEDPGEQSLTGWWRRSQSSFHEGAGNLYQESNTGSTPGNGFYDSSGVDVFTQGKFTLLKKMKTATITGALYTHIRTAAGGVFSAVGDGALHKATAASGSYTSLHAPATKVIVDGLIANTYFYDVATDGTLYEGTVASPGTATSWACGGAPTRLTWGKYRLWVIGGRDIWQPDLTLAAGSTQNPVFTNPNRGWTYTCVAEGPNAMYFGGHDGLTSSIQAITLDGSLTTVPYLSGATTAVVLPNGELVQEIAVLAGQFLGIGTNRGFRIGVINSDGSVAYGPLLIEPTGITSCSAITAHGRFFVVAFATASGNAMAYRFDTSVQVSDGVFAYAADVDCGFAGSITSLTPNAGLLVATVNNGAVYYQSSTEYVDTGYITSGRIRFRTTEPKSYVFFGLEIEPLQGSVAVQIVKDDGSLDSIGTVTIQGATFTDLFQYSGAPMKFASVKITLAPTADKLNTPVINSHLVKALPAVKPQRLIIMSLLCFDKEQSRSGQRYGGPDFAADRLAALLQLEDEAVPITYQDFVGGVGNHQVVIESLRYTETAPPTGHDGTGGVIEIELRTVDA
jgi:hypothetical protein